MQAMPEIKTPRIHPPIALFNDTPKNNPITAHKIIIITDTKVLNFFIQSHASVKFLFIYQALCPPMDSLRSIVVAPSCRLVPLSMAFLPYLSFISIIAS